MSRSRNITPRSTVVTEPLWHMFVMSMWKYMEGEVLWWVVRMNLRQHSMRVEGIAQISLKQILPTSTFYSRENRIETCSLIIFSSMEITID